MLNTWLSKVATAAIAATIGLAGIAQAQSSENNVFIAQISVERSPQGADGVIRSVPNDYGNLRDFTFQERRLISSLPTASSLGLGAANQSSVTQIGLGNSVVASIVGRGNFVNQLQIGRNLSSEVDFRGDNNSANVVQTGRGGASDISVRGSNKTITHIQLGSDPGTLGEFEIRGRNPEEFIYVQRADGSESLYKR